MPLGISCGVVINTNCLSVLPFMFTVSRFECSNGCGRSYKYKKGVIQHLRYECSMLPIFKCSMCHKMFKRHRNLKIQISPRACSFNEQTISVEYICVGNHYFTLNKRYLYLVYQSYKSWICINIKLMCCQKKNMKYNLPYIICVLI